MKVLIATKNQGKIEGAKKALEHYFKDIEIKGIPVESDVPEQPVIKEIYEGAKNRVKNLKEYAKENNIEAELFLGIESGINDLLGRWMITNIAVIEDNKDFESYGTSPSFPVPNNLVQKVLDTNLSKAMDLGEDKERHNHSGGIQLRKSTDDACKTCIIMGSGYSLSIDHENKVIYKDPLFFPPSGNAYGDYTVLSLFYPFECEGLSCAAEELANYINFHMQQYDNIILHGHSKCGSCFVKATEWLKRRVTIISVSAPLNEFGTPIANRKIFDSRLNWLEKIFFYKIFSDHNVDKDLCENSEFLINLNMKYLIFHNYEIIVSSCDKFTINPVQLLLIWVDKFKNINGDGIIPMNSQIPKGVPFTRILATHVDSMKKSIRFVKKFL